MGIITSSGKAVFSQWKLLLKNDKPDFSDKLEKDTKDLDGQMVTNWSDCEMQYLSMLCPKSQREK